jgi:phosphinothricin acetyltransferase
MIRGVELTDTHAICAIYNPYVTETIVTFEELPVSPDEMTDRIKEITQTLPWLVDCENGVVRGYAYARKWQARSAYRYSVDTTIYVARAYQRKRVGTLLYSELLAQLRRLGLHTAVGSIALPNDASVTFHEKLGFRKVAHFKQVGLKFGKWIDVGYWQILLDSSAQRPDRADHVAREQCE